MKTDFTELGERLRAYRMGVGLSPEEVARHLRISRAALYNYEKGGVLKLDTIQRLSALLGVSVSTLLGGGTEYFSTPVAYFERKRQVERKSEQLFVCSEPISVLLASADYLKHLRQMLAESHEGSAAPQAVSQIVDILNERRNEPNRQFTHTLSVVSAPQIVRFVQTGLVGRHDLPARSAELRRRWAHDEVIHLANMIESEPMGVQVGVIEDMLPSLTFEIFRQRERTLVAVSPYRLGEFPNVRIGVASLTGEPEAVAAYEAMADDLWGRAQKGAPAAARLRELADEAIARTGGKPPRRIR